MKMIFTLVALTALALSTEAWYDLNCDFEHESCQWSNDQRSWRSIWTVMTYSTDNSNSVCCLRGRTEQPGRLWSVPITSKMNIRCLRFTFTFDSSGNSPMTLSLLKHSLRSCRTAKDKRTGLPSVTCTNEPIWTSDVAYNRWHNREIDLSETEADFKLILEGTIPEGNPDAKICVDNITSHAQPCSALGAAASTRPLDGIEHMIFIFAGALTLGLVIPISLLLVRLHRRKRRGKKMSRLSCVVVAGGDVVVPPPTENGTHMAPGRLPAVPAGRSNAGAAAAAANAAAAARRAPPPPPATAPPMPDDRGQPPSYPGTLERPPRYEEAMGLLDDKVPTAEL